MKTSVVMTTYNGEKYVEEQLDSLRAQSLQPEEVIILDDCSQDNTPFIVKSYIQRYKLSNWFFYENEFTQGWRKNFMSGFCKAKGDIIFPCDQDDIWNLDKIEQMTDIMKENQDILVLASNFNVLNMSDEKKIRGVYRDRNDGTVDKVEFTKRFMHIRRPGCVFCFRRSLMPDLCFIWTERQAHDALLWRAGILEDGLYVYHRQTIQWRRSNQSATLGSRDSWTERKTAYLSWREQCEKMLELLNREDKYGRIANRESKKNIIKKYLEMIDIILSYRVSPKKGKLIQLFMYCSYFPSNKGAIKEICLQLRNK